MNIEQGDYFVVTRGFPLSMDSWSAFSEMLGGGGVSTKQEQQYDRSHEGEVFLAVEVCGPVIAARRVFTRSRYHPLGEALSLNTSELEVWPVTKQYLASLQQGSST